jgi:hypothetical protein
MIGSLYLGSLYQCPGGDWQRNDAHDAHTHIQFRTIFEQSQLTEWELNQFDVWYGQVLPTNL